MPQTQNYKFYNCVTWCRRSLIFQTMNCVRPKSIILNYQRFTPPDIGIRKFEFVAKTQVFYMWISIWIIARSREIATSTFSVSERVLEFFKFWTNFFSYNNHILLLHDKPTFYSWFPLRPSPSGCNFKL